MKLGNLLTEGRSGNWWITPAAKPVFLGDSGHEDYMADNGLQYASAFYKGYIRAITTTTGADFMFAPKRVSKKTLKAMAPLIVNKKVVHVDPVNMTSKTKYTYDYSILKNPKPKMTPEEFEKVFLQ